MEPQRFTQSNPFLEPLKSSLGLCKPRNDEETLLGPSPAGQQVPQDASRLSFKASAAASAPDMFAHPWGDRLEGLLGLNFRPTEGRGFVDPLQQV